MNIKEIQEVVMNDLEAMYFESQKRLKWFITGYGRHCLDAKTFNIIPTTRLCELYNVELSFFNLHLHKLKEALSDSFWKAHKIGDEYQMDGKKDVRKIVYYPIFQDGKNGEQYEEPRALVEKNTIFNGVHGIDFREVPLRYLKIK